MTETSEEITTLTHQAMRASLCAHERQRKEVQACLRTDLLFVPVLITFRAISDTFYAYAFLLGALIILSWMRFIAGDWRDLLDPAQLSVARLGYLIARLQDKLGSDYQYSWSRYEPLIRSEQYSLIYNFLGKIITSLNLKQPDDRYLFAAIDR